MPRKKKTFFHQLPDKLIAFTGTTKSLILHTIFFAGMFMLTFFGWELQKMLLVLTTLLSIEAIYLALFIQMSVNKTSKSLAEVEKDIDVIQAEDKKDEQLDREVSSTLRSIQQRLSDLQQDIAWLQEMEPARQITEYTNSTQEKK